MTFSKTIDEDRWKCITGLVGLLQNIIVHYLIWISSNPVIAQLNSQRSVKLFRWIWCNLVQIIVIWKSIRYNRRHSMKLCLQIKIDSNFILNSVDPVLSFAYVFLLCLFVQYLHTFVILWHRVNGTIRFDDSTLLPCNFTITISQQCGMFETQRCNANRFRISEWFDDEIKWDLWCTNAHKHTKIMH